MAEKLPTPPGLLCATCTGEFRGQLARRTPTGWVHARDCVSPMDLTEKPGRWVKVGNVQRWVAA